MIIDERYLALVFTAASVLGSVWAMHRELEPRLVAAFMCAGLAGLSVFAVFAA